MEVTANHFKESALSPGDVECAQEGKTALGQIEDIRNNGRKVFQQRRHGYGYIPFAPQSSAGGEDRRRTPEQVHGKRQLKAVLTLWKAVSSPCLSVELGATTVAQHNNCCPTQLLHLMDCHYTTTDSALLKDPRSSQQSCLAYEPWDMAGALHSARAATKACVLRT